VGQTNRLTKDGTFQENRSLFSLIPSVFAAGAKHLAVQAGFKTLPADRVESVAAIESRLVNCDETIVRMAGLGAKSANNSLTIQPI
jgi:hypothetical protein